MDQEWHELGQRSLRRVIRTLDVITILSLDSVILAFGYVLIRAAAALSGSGSRFFEAAREVRRAVPPVIVSVGLF
jgi:hypothetical protein